MIKEDLLKILRTGNKDLIISSLLAYKPEFFKNRVYPTLGLTVSNNSELDSGVDIIKTAETIFNTP